MRLTALSFATVFLAVFSLVQPIHAEPLNPEGAEKLKAIFSDMLAYQEDAMAVNDLTLKADGEIKIEPAETYYAVTLPHLSVQADDGEGFFDIGIIAINAAPTEDEGVWRMSVALPTPMTGYDQNGSPLFTVDFGRQRMSGLWHEAFRNFVALDAAYENVSAQDTQGKFQMLLPVSRIVYDMTENENGDWSGPVLFEVNDISVRVEGSEVLSIDAVESNSEILEMSPQAIAEYQEKIAALTENLSEAENPDEISAGHATGFYNTVMDFLTTAWDGFTSQITIRGLKVTAGPEKDEKFTSMAFDSLGYGFDMTGFKEDSVTLAMRFGYSGLVVEPETPEYQEIVPGEVSFNLVVKDLPFTKLAALGKDTLEASLKSPEMAQMSGMQAVMTTPQLLAESGTVAELKETRVIGPAYSFEINGIVNADAAAQFGATADAKAVITGLDKITARITEKINDPETTEQMRQKLQQHLQGVAFVQMLGQQETMDDGAQGRVYNLEVTRDGQMLLNGTDLSALMAAQRGGQGAAPQRGVAPQAPQQQQPAPLPPAE